MNIFYNTIAAAETAGMQSNPTGNCDRIYRVNHFDGPSYTPSLEIASMALENGVPVTPMHKHYKRGWECSI